MRFLTVIVKIKNGFEERLRTVLDEIQNDLAGNPYVRFPESRLTHFARWLILHDEEHGARLVFAANYDGDLNSYLQELLDVSPNLDPIWGNCEGYTGAQHFVQFMRRYSMKNRGTYVGFPDETLESLRNKIAIRRQLEDMLDQTSASETLSADELQSLLYRFSLLLPPPSRFSIVKGRVNAALLRIFKRAHSAFFTPYLRFARWYSEYGMPRTYPRVTSRCDQTSPTPVGPTPAPVGNQTSFVVFAKVKPGHLPRMLIALAASNTLTKFAYRTGEFTNVYTLHEFRWIILDRGKRLIFMSTFDGSWENYMGDFIDNLVWALDAIYSNTEGYPPAGMKEVVKFKAWIREHQPIASVVYNAYPEETVLNLIRDSQIAEALKSSNDPQSILRCLQLL